jgi:hypothetical protein
MKTEELFENTPFVNEECGDTMWNDENLNPPKGKEEKSPEPETFGKETVQDSSTSGGM